MRKALPFLGASLSVLAISMAAPSQAQNAKLFQDVPQSHWAYDAVTDLQNRGILLGYPDGYFRGKRPLTRYEFAVALQRALAKLPNGTPGPKGDTGATGPAGEAGPAGPAGPPGVTPEELARFRALAAEFQSELAAIGANIKDINSRLDALSRDVADIQDYLRRQIKFGGELFGGFRSDQSRVPFYDYSGAVRGANRSLLENVNAIHDFHLDARGTLPGGVKANVELVASNYLSYRANSVTGAGAPGPNPFSQAGPVGATFLGGPSGANPNGGPEEVTLYEANLSIPIGGFGSGTQLQVGRYKHQVTPLTYYRPDTDAYFDLPWYDDGNWIEDGVKLESKFGSAKTSVFAGSYRSLTTTGGGVINTPLVGANVNPANGANRFNGALKPTSLALAPEQAAAGESAGVHIAIPILRLGELGATLIDFGNASSLPLSGNFNNVVVYGVNFKANAVGRFTFSGEAAKSVTQRGTLDGDPSNINDDDNAYVANLGYNTGPVNAIVGYQYIDPRFAAPGYWNKIGNWYNPTNISGPYARVTYNFSNALVGFIGGDYYTGARNRPFVGGLTRGSNIERATAGVKYNLNKHVNVGATYEGVIYDLSGAASASGLRAKPVEQYLTFNAGLNLASNTVLKFAYQILNQQDVGGGFGSLTGAGINGANLGHDANASVFTTQLAVHF